MTEPVIVLDAAPGLQARWSPRLRLLAAVFLVLAAGALEAVVLPQPAAAQAFAPPAETTETAGERAAVPVRIALQAGHWRSAEAPDELARLRGNGTLGGGKHEWEVTLDIARRAAALLEAKGYEVEILPATVPPGYRADLFIAIHADGFHSPAASGFSVGSPRRDATGRAQAFADLLASRYLSATGLRHRVATRRMRGYYAFNARRYRHALHPSTVAVILEAGFLTSPRDQALLIGTPERSARGIAEAVEAFLPVGMVAEAGQPEE
jgi:hypothetical protein